MCTNGEGRGGVGLWTDDGERLKWSGLTWTGTARLPPEIASERAGEEAQ